MIYLVWGIFLFLLVVIGWLLRRTEQNTYRLNRADAQYQLWLHSMAERGRIEAWAKGLAKLEYQGVPSVDSCSALPRLPMRVTDEARHDFAPIIPALQLWYNSQGRGRNDEDLIEEIQRFWGEWIIQNFCMIHRVSHLSCLIIALELARESVQPVQGEAS